MINYIYYFLNQKFLEYVSLDAVADADVDAVNDPTIPMV
jgi:hypothetical protein